MESSGAEDRGARQRRTRHAACSTCARMDKANDRVVAGRYLLGEVIGAGGMGTVYRADDLAHGRAVAIKFLHPAGPALAAHHLASEGLVGRAIHHPNVVSVSHAGITSEGTAFLIMELVCGVPLDELVHTEGPLALRRATAIVGQILAGLGALHQAGFVHGDVKSGNVLIDASDGDRVKLIDLGLAHRARAPDPSGEHVASGTPEYMAPEVVRGEGAVPRSDLYAAGAVLYQLLTGTTPFEGGSPREVLRRQLHDLVVPPSLRCPDRTIPAALEHAVMIALAKDPAARHATAAAFAEAIATATPMIEPASPGPATRPAFSTEAPTLDWRPPGLPAPEPSPPAADPRRPPRSPATAPGGDPGRPAAVR